METSQSTKGYISAELKHEVVSIHPAIALAILQFNNKNRPVKRAHLQFLEKEMAEGQWKLNGDAIRIGTDGTLIDGQHRLMACINTGVEFRTLLVTGLNPDTFDTIDTGAHRSTGDTLAVRGEKNGRSIAASLIVVKQLIGGFTKFEHREKISNHAMLDLLREHAGISESVRFGDMVRRIAPVSLGIGLHYLFKKTNAQKAESFFSSLHDGLNLTFDDPIYLLRQRLINESTSKTKISKRYICALMIKAWNCHCISGKLKNLRYREQGEFPEPFPVINGLSSVYPHNTHEAMHPDAARCRAYSEA